MRNIKSKSKGKKALMILAVIFAVILLLLLGAYLFVSRVVPLQFDVQTVKTAVAEQSDMSGMYVSWEPYENADLRLAGETQTVESDRFSLTLPVAFTETTTPYSAENGTRTYVWSENGETLAAVIISSPLYALDAELSKEEKVYVASYKRLMLTNHILYGYAAKKAFGVTLKDQYSFDLVSNSLNLDKIASDDVYAAYLASTGIGIFKTVGAASAARAIYKVDTPQYNGFIYDFDYTVKQMTDETVDRQPQSISMTMDAYTPDNRYFSYSVSMTAKNGTLSETDVFAIFNSFQVK